ncbi:MAG: pyruvate kinase [Planctomycetota bacterium]|jgi:pyruvate kinase
MSELSSSNHSELTEMPPLEVEGVNGFQKARTKIVATIGPATEDRIEDLINAGMSVARLNFSHGVHAEHRKRAELIREASHKTGQPVAILADIQGPKMRLGLFVGGKLRVTPGERFRLLEGGGLAEHGEIYFNVEGFLEAVKPGQRIYLADGVVEMVVEGYGKDGLIGAVRRGGNLGDKKGVHLPDSELKINLPTAKDILDIAFIRELELDMIGISFVGSAADVRTVRELAPEMQLVSKIERVAALEAIDGILEETDGIMVARGDLGVEVELERLPIVQKSLINAAYKAGVFSITATEMLESMVVSSRPTRAEVADVANAILDGSDAVMLSAETAVGHFPIEAVRVMQRVALSVEKSSEFRKRPDITFRDSEPTFSNAIALAAVRVAESISLRKIVCFTESGNTVRQISRYRPRAEVIALTPHERTQRSMTILAHVQAFLLPRVVELDQMLEGACDFLVEQGLAKEGEEIVFVAGVPAGQTRTTNLIKLHRVGERVRLG